MKTLYSEHYNKIADSKYPKSETEPYNPWAVCNKSTGGEKESPEKFERCVHHLKEQNKEENTKDVRPGRHVHYRRNENPDDIFQRRLDDELSGKAKQDDEQRLDDIWLDSLRRQRQKEREPVFAFAVSAKKKYNG